MTFSTSTFTVRVRRLSSTRQRTAVQAWKAAMDANGTLAQCLAALKLLKPRDEDVTVYDEEADRIAAFAANYPDAAFY